MENQKVLILDCGSAHAQILARRIRNLNVYSEVRPYKTDLEKIKDIDYQAFVFIGSPDGPADRYQDIKKTLGIYQTFGKPILLVDIDSDIAVENKAEKIYSLKNKIEYIQSEAEKQALKEFLYDIAQLKGDWKIADFIENQIDQIRAEVGDKKLVLGLSGGVDSTVAAVLVHKAVGAQLTCILVDHGLMRKNEADDVEKLFREKYDMQFVHVKAEERFLNRLADVTDPEKKRKIIGEEFIRVFEEESNKIEDAEYLVQGTIYPDIIESDASLGKMVKSHHNVGGLPEDINFKGIVEPLKDLFKDEVRKVGIELGLPENMVNRQPFPGPGLGVRIIGAIAKAKADILREADAIMREEIEKAGLDKEINQYFAVLTGIQSVGVRNENRTYDYTIALRAVKTVDFMTATYYPIPYEILDIITKRITQEVEGVNRIVYDITGKPPATIEWE